MEKPLVKHFELFHVPEGHREHLRCIFNKFKNMLDGHLEETKISSPRIYLEPKAQPVTHRPYRTGLKARKIVAEEVNGKCKANITTPVSSEQVSLVVTVRIHDGLYCMCIDNSKPSAVIICGTYPLPQMDARIDSRGMKQYFQHWMLTGGTGRCLLRNTIKKSHLYQPC